MAPNGSGKTTFIKLLLKLLKESKGTIENPFAMQDSFTLFDDLSLYKNLSGLENIKIFTGFKFSKNEIMAAAGEYLPQRRLYKQVKHTLSVRERSYQLSSAIFYNLN